MLALFASITPLAACGIDTSPFTENYCDGELQVLADVLPAQPTDYLELAIVSDNDAVQLEVFDSAGTLCGGSSDPGDCQARFAALDRRSALHAESYRAISLAYTRGDEVGVVQSESDLRALLGPIDSAADAALLVSLAQMEHRLVCDDKNDAARDGDNFIVHTESGNGCPSDVEEHVVEVTANGQMSVIDTVRTERGDKNCTVGRRPAGLRPFRLRRSGHPVGRYLATMATLEAAAVPAFGRMIRELCELRAPAPLVDQARRARWDEVRHAAIIGAHARRWGGRMRKPEVAALPTRSRFEIARENVTEGCVRETWGALVAHAQAHRAHDPKLRRDLARIAHDESRHAALSWAVDGWLRAGLDAAARRRLDRAADEAVANLRHELKTGFAPEVHRVTGLPDPQTSIAMFDRLRAGLTATVESSG